jgi:hypothetical protein
MANTYTFTLSGSKVLVEVFDQTPTLIDNYTLSTEHNVFVHPNKNNTVVISQNTNYQGTDAVSYEYNTKQINTNPTPNDALATAVWLGTNFFVGTSVGAGGATEAKQDDIITALGSLALEVTAEAINLNTDTLESSNDAIQAAVEALNLKVSESNLKKLKDGANDLVKTASYYTGVDPVSNPSGTTSNIETIVYSSVALALTVTETFTWDANDNFLTSTLS